MCCDDPRDHAESEGARFGTIVSAWRRAYASGGMTDDEKWSRWCEGVLDHLDAFEHAGFAVLSYACTILERAVRIHIGMKPDETLGDIARSAAFFAEVEKAVPELKPLDQPGVGAPVFWGVVRNGLAHDLAASKRDYQGIQLVRLRIDPGASTVAYDGDCLVVGPRAFANAVITYVKNIVTVKQFAQGNAAAEILPLPDVQSAHGGGVPFPLVLGVQTEHTESHERKP